MGCVAYSARRQADFKVAVMSTRIGHLVSYTTVMDTRSARSGLRIRARSIRQFVTQRAVMASSKPKTRVDFRCASPRPRPDLLDPLITAAVAFPTALSRIWTREPFPTCTFIPLIPVDALAALGRVKPLASKFSQESFSMRFHSKTVDVVMLIFMKN